MTTHYLVIAQVPKGQEISIAIEAEQSTDAWAFGQKLAKVLALLEQGKWQIVEFSQRKRKGREYL